MNFIHFPSISILLSRALRELRSDRTLWLHPLLVRDINHGFEQQEEETFLLLCQCHSLHHLHHLQKLLLGEYPPLYEWPSCFSGWDTIRQIEHLFFYINCLPNLELAFEFICPFIIREGALYSNKVENLFVFTVVADMSPNQLSIPHYAPYLWLTLKQKFPLAFNNLFHLFPLKCSPNRRLVKDIESKNFHINSPFQDQSIPGFPPPAWQAEFGHRLSQISDPLAP